jgi:hypothetical protein
LTASLAEGTATGSATFYTNGASVSFGPAITDTESGIGTKAYYLDTATAATYADGISFSVNAGSSKVLHAYDRLGNKTDFTIYVVSDTTAPVLTMTATNALTSTGASSVNDSAASGTIDQVFYYTAASDVFTATGSDGTGNSGFRGLSATSGAYTPFTNSGSAVGSVATVYAWDNAGNVSKGINVTVTQDSKHPAVTVTSDGGRTSAGSLTASLAEGTATGSATFYTNGASVSFGPAITDSESGIGTKAYYLDSDTGTTYADGISFSVNAGSSKVLHVYDRLGNESDYTINVVSDTSPPTMTKLTSPANGLYNYYGASTDYTSATAAVVYTNGPSIAFTPAASDSGGSGIYGYSLSSTGSSPIPTLAAMTCGSTYTVYAVDNAGNVSSTGVAVIPTADTTVPTLSITTNVATTAASVNSVTISAGDTGSKLASIMATSGTVTPTATVAGSSSVSATITNFTDSMACTITVKDNVGNISYVMCYAKWSGYAITAQVNGPMLWTLTGNALGNMGFVGSGGPSASNISKSATTEDYAAGISDISGLTIGTTYYFNVSNGPVLISVPFKKASSTTVIAASMIFGNPVIGTRLVNANAVDDNALPVASALGNRDNALASWRAVSPKVRATQLTERAAAKQAAAKAEEKERAEASAKSAATVTPLEKLHAMALVRAQSGLAAPAVKADASVAKPATVDKPEVLENRAEAMKAIFLPLATKYLSAHGVIFGDAQNGDSSTNALPSRVGAEMGLLDSREPSCLQRRFKVVGMNG